MKEYKKGSITVFLSLILLLVLSVIMTTVEAARVNAASALSLRALMIGQESAMAEYYSPLYDEYHIFGLDASYGSLEINEEMIEEKINSYMEYTFTPGKDLIEDGLNSTLDMYSVEIEKTDTESVISLLDFNGELFEKQALEFMKYKVPADTAASFFDKTSAIENTKKSVEVLEEKKKTDVKVQQLDDIILKLMEKIDGISITKNGVKMKSGQIAVKEFFVKKFLANPVSMGSSGINNEWTFNTLKTHYRDVPLELSVVIKQLDTISSLNNSIDRVQAEIISLVQTDTSKFKRKERNAHNQKIESANSQLNSLISEKQTLIGNINNKVKEFKQQIGGVNKTIQEAISIIDNGHSIQQDITLQIESYEDLVISNKGVIGEEFYNELIEGVELLSRYKVSNGNDKVDNNDLNNGSNYDFTSMKQQLQENEHILNNASNYLSTSLTTSDNSIVELRTSLIGFQNQMKQYNTSNLRFDYSTLTQPVDSEPFFSEVRNIIKNGLMGVVVEEESTLSNKEIGEESLPSELLEEDSSAAMSINSLQESINLEKGLSVFDNMLSSSILQTTAKVGEKGLNLMLYGEYLDNHFGYFANEKESNIKALNYELEYILTGNIKDTDNLSSMVTQILTIRTVLNLITLLSDGAKANEAKLLAASFVGFTGMPLLVEAVKIIILTVWALVESLVDISALLKNRAVPIFKTGKEIQINLKEILVINKVLIHKKANNYKDLKAPLTLTYKDYIGIFLFFQNEEDKLYRTMDLIQENLQLNYEETFYIKNCITGLNVTGFFKMESKFVSIPFVNGYLNEDTGGYQFKFSREYTY